MKAKKQEHRKTTAAVVTPKPRPAARPAWMWYVMAAFGSLVAVFVVYYPSLNGQFQFDDTSLPIGDLLRLPLRFWVLGLRPILMLSYWVNARVSGTDPYSFHVINVFIHWMAGILIFPIVRRLAEWGGVPQSRRSLLAGFAAAVFLFHPVQSEAVAYVAGRSESLSDMLVFAAFAVFLYRRGTRSSWGVAAAVLALFGAAVLSKEHTVALVGLLLLTDFWWNPGFSLKGIAGNWKLYLPIVLGAAAGVYKFRNLLTNATTAGFGMKDLTWYQYFFTQCRALFVYPFQFLLPVRLNADWNFPMSKTILDHGAIFGLVGLIALVAAAWHFRKRYSLAAYGFFVYLVLMAPTSSILPIKDAVAERRVYLSILGLLLILVDILGRVRIDRKPLITACTVVTVVLAGATYVRAGVWADPIALWTDTVSKGPGNRRAHFQLAYAEWTSGHPDLAVAEFQRTADIGPVTSDLLLDWGLALDSLNQPDQALEKLRQSAAMDPTVPAYINVAKIRAQRSQWPEALAAADSAQKVDPDNAIPYSYRGKIYLQTTRVCEAIAEFKRALALDPRMDDARHDLAVAEQMPHDCK